MSNDWPITRTSNEVSSLKENVDAFADCRGTSEERSMDSREEPQNEESGRESEEKIRNCLVCKSPFPSAWAGERICRRCKSTSTWRSGALG